MKTLITFLIGSTITFSGLALSKKEQDIQAIKSLCGCYEIDFDFTETFAPDSTYVFHEDYHTHAPAEVAFIIEESENFISIQHLLVMDENTIIKHWREDWVYENQDLLDFVKDMQWGYRKLSETLAKGTWTQKVFQVDDSPRYEGYATWVHADGRHYWDSKTYGPLPRREYSKRSDYNVLHRHNRIELNEAGWTHEQDNTKIIRTAEGDKVLAQEKGFNTYKLQDDSKCQAGIDWWKKNEEYWALVRKQWDRIYKLNQGVNLAIKIENKTLWQELFAIGRENEGEKMAKSKEIKNSVNSAIEKFIIQKS